MKKFRLFIIFAFIFACISGCSSNEVTEYSQSYLPEPDRIEIVCDTDKASYEKDTEKYQAIYRAVNENWWKTSLNEAEIIDNNTLTSVDNLKQIKTTSNMVYASGNEVFISFYYDTEPLKWTKSAKETAEIGEVLFVLPEYPEENKCVKGFFGVYRADRPQSHEGIYTYYFSDELFETLSENDKIVTTIYNATATEIDLQYFSNLTFEEIQPKLIEVHAWTHLMSHQLYWNSTTEQVVINHTFSEKASEKELDGARDYWKTMEIIRSNWPKNLNIVNTYNRIPKNAEVIMQVFVKDELVSQDIYRDIEDNMIYRIEHYTKEENTNL